MPLTGARLVIGHLFPDRLNLYGDRGNVMTLTERARWRGVEVMVETILEDHDDGPLEADVLFIGGGPDGEQTAVAHALERFGARIVDAVAAGSVLLAVCGGYQNLGRSYRSALVGELAGPGLLDVDTEAPPSGERIVGGLVVKLPTGSPIAAGGAASAEAAGHAGAHDTIVGFENHSGRTHLGAGARPLGSVDAGHGNNGGDGTEGLLAMPGDGGMDGLRIGTYLHGPLLPRNPHLADFILATALQRQGVGDLPPLADQAEWDAHAAFAGRWQRSSGRRPRSTS